MESMLPGLARRSPISLIADGRREARIDKTISKVLELLLPRGETECG